MRGDETRAKTEAATASLSRLMDDFASLSTHTATPAIGGYRVLPAHRKAPARRHAPVPTRASRTPMRMTGTLALLLVSSLGVAAFSGPATCPCGLPETVAGQTAPTAQNVSRFAYAELIAPATSSATPLASAEVAAVGSDEARSPSVRETIELAEAGEPVGVSPISTAAIDPITPRRTSTMRAPDTRGGLLPARMVELADTAPRPIRLAAATPVEGAPAGLPEVVVVSPQLSDIVAREAKPEPRSEPTAVAQKRTTHKRRRAYRAYRSVPESRERKRARLANIPPWAEKMFATSWQSKAFNY